MISRISLILIAIKLIALVSSTDFEVAPHWSLRIVKTQSPEEEVQQINLGQEYSFQLFSYQMDRFTGTASLFVSNPHKPHRRLQLGPVELTSEPATSFGSGVGHVQYFVIKADFGTFTVSGTKPVLLPRKKVQFTVSVAFAGGNRSEATVKQVFPVIANAAAEEKTPTGEQTSEHPVFKAAMEFGQQWRHQWSQSFALDMRSAMQHYFPDIDKGNSVPVPLLDISSVPWFPSRGAIVGLKPNTEHTADAENPIGEDVQYVVMPYIKTTGGLHHFLMVLRTSDSLISIIDSNPMPHLRDYTSAVLSFTSILRRYERFNDALPEINVDFSVSEPESYDIEGQLPRFFVWKGSLRQFNPFHSGMLTVMHSIYIGMGREPVLEQIFQEAPEPATPRDGAAGNSGEDQGEREQPEEGSAQVAREDRHLQSVSAEQLELFRNTLLEQIVRLCADARRGSLEECLRGAPRIRWAQSVEG